MVVVVAVMVAVEAVIVAADFDARDKSNNKHIYCSEFGSNNAWHKKELLALNLFA